MSKRLKVSGFLFGLSLLLLSGANALAGGVRVVSDIDDTAKITNVQKPTAMILNSMFSNASFVGMKEVYTSFEVEHGYAFHYVTGTPSLFRAKVRDFLSDNGFPAGEVITRPLFKDLYEFKLAAVKDLLVKYPDDQFILIGDDTQKDVQVYDEIYRYAPKRVLAVYIRKVMNRSLPASIFPFVTAYDIARTEYLMGRFNVWDASPVAITVIGEEKDNLIVPKFMYCPAKRIFRIGDPKIEEWNDRINDRVQKICKTRRLPDEVL